MSTTYPDLDVTDDNEPEQLSENDKRIMEILEYDINTMNISEVVGYAMAYLGNVMKQMPEEAITERHDSIFKRELH
jgi:hypothetical protein